ncbi:MAG: SUMF1/EgtB/PvdO family nonheme iron enzyme [Chromatiales bacterium]|nr:SUMF1/EgtB/PvdO family nonheme iron enzyme [Chromatiales bacterium]
MHPKRPIPWLKWILILLALVVAGGLFYVAKYSWYERYVWPSTIEGMDAPPPPDRSVWPAEPYPLKIETQRVEVATPQGLAVREITYQVNSLDMDLVRIDAGAFIQEPTFGARPDRRAWQRASRWYPPSGPQAHQVTVTRPYLIGAFEVTNAQFERFDPSHRDRRAEYQPANKPVYDRHPAEPVSWTEAQAFCRWLSEREGRLYRLPTEAEWELAAKAGTTARFYWGEAFWDRSLANLGGLHSNAETLREDSYKQTAPVGMYPANPWGLYDMLGNSYEWVADWWHEPHATDVVDPTGPDSGRLRMAKGGSWTTRPYAMYIGENDGNNPADLRDMRGFRVLAELPPSPTAANR